MGKLEHFDKLNQEQQKLLLNKWKQDKINEVKQTIISLAYSDFLTPYDLDELSQIINTISLYRVRKNEGNK